MIRRMLKSKIHRVTVTDTNLDYEGSLGIDADLMKAADIVPYELVHVYAIEESPGSGAIDLKGAAAKKGDRGDLIIIACYTSVDDKNLKEFKPKIILVDKENKIKEDV